MILDEDTEQVYRTISFNNQDSDNTSLPADRFQVVFDAGFKHRNYIKRYRSGKQDYAGAGTTMGATVGDVVLAIDKLTTQQARINNNDMILAWHGKSYVVANYTDRGTYATVELNDVILILTVMQ